MVESTTMHKTLKEYISVAALKEAKQ